MSRRTARRSRFRRTDSDGSPEAEPSRRRKALGERRPGIDWLFAIMMLLLVGKAFLTRALALGDLNPLWAILLETAGLLVVFGLADLIWPRRSYTIDLVVFGLLSALMFGNTLYVAYYEQMVDPHMFAFAGQAGTVGESIVDLLTPWHLLFFIDLPFLIVAAVLVRRAERQRLARWVFAGRGQKSSGRGRSVPVAIAVGIGVVILAFQVVTLVRLPGTVDGLAAAQARGMGAWQIATLVRSTGGASSSEVAVADEVASEETSLTPAQRFQVLIDEAHGPQTGSRVASFPPGAAAGKNVIVIQVESLNTMIIGKKIGGRAITPNLNKLLAESWYFPNTYSQTGGGNTSDAEFVVNSSLVPPPDGQASSLAYANREIPGLPRLLSQQGYRSITLHANEARYWNRSELYPALGFDKYYDREFFPTTDNIWRGPSDELVFSEGMKLLKGIAAKGQPFYAHFITLSSHPPFRYIPASRRPLPVPAGYEGTLVGNYVSAESYSDKALGEFVVDLKKSGLWNSSVVVIYGDHSAFKEPTTDKDKALVAKLLGRPHSLADRQRVPLIIHVPGQTAGRVEQKTTGFVDIMPTIADLVGVDLSQVPHLGRSVFVRTRQLLTMRSYFRSGAVITDKFVYTAGLTATDGSAVRVSDGSPVAVGAEQASAFERNQKMSALSDAWLRTLPMRADASNGKGAFIPVQTPAEKP